MPRPEEITGEMIEDWDSDVDPSMEALMGLMPKLREVSRAGCWVGEKLRDAGVQNQEIADIQFSMGQKALYVEDVWELAKETVAKYMEDGSYDEPGAELAERLIEEGRDDATI